jgi:hypothetical protein
MIARCHRPRDERFLDDRELEGRQFTVEECNAGGSLGAEKKNASEMDGAETTADIEK